AAAPAAAAAIEAATVSGGGLTRAASARSWPVSFSRAAARWAVSGSASKRATPKPCCRAIRAIPPPIVPAPMTASFFGVKRPILYIVGQMCLLGYVIAVGGELTNSSGLVLRTRSDQDQIPI